MKPILLSIILSTVVFQSASAAFCGSTAIPFRFEVLENGEFVLGCATPACMCAKPAGDSQFNVGLLNFRDS